MASEITRALTAASSNRLLHTSIACLLPRKRPGNRNPMPEEEIRRRVEEIVYGGRKKPEPPDFIDYDFKKVGEYRIKDKKIQDLYREYLRLYHPELAGDVPENKSNGGDNKQSSKQKDEGGGNLHKQNAAQ